MKFVFLLGDAAVGKMTVGQALAKITNLRLFHNHMAIEPVIEIFGKYDGEVVSKLREVVFQCFAASDNYGMIFTYMMAFDRQEDWDYLQHVKDIFSPYDTEFYYVELDAPQKVRLERNATKNRLEHKPSKRDLQLSNERLVEADKKYRCVSYEGEVKFDNFLRIDNSQKSPDEVAQIIKETFTL